MKTIIYGIGKRCFGFFFKSNSIEKEIIEKEIEIIGFADSDSTMWGKEILYDKKRYKVKSISDFHQSGDYGILITTEKYFEEIKESLIKNGHLEEYIFSIDSFIEQYLNKQYYIDKFKDKSGIEIGGPTELFFNVYNNCLTCDNVNFSSSTVWGMNDTHTFTYMNKKLGDILIAEATNMDSIADSTYDFVLSSNNLEHIANPLKALKEFSRIVKKDGIVLVLVPIKEKIFDHKREYTAFEHLLADYQNNIGEDDLSHLPEIIEKHDYAMDIQCGGKEKFIERAKKNIENRCLHHHVFEEECLRKSMAFADLKVIAFRNITENWLIIGQK